MTKDEAQRAMAEGRIANFCVDESGVVHTQELETGNWTPPFGPQQDKK